MTFLEAFFAPLVQCTSEIDLALVLRIGPLPGELLSCGAISVWLQLDVNMGQEAFNSACRFLATLGPSAYPSPVPYCIRRSDAAETSPLCSRVPAFIEVLRKLSSGVARGW